jgi:hypothetical protein
MFPRATYFTIGIGCPGTLAQLVGPEQRTTLDAIREIPYHIGSIMGPIQSVRHPVLGRMKLRFQNYSVCAALISLMAVIGACDSAPTSPTAPTSQSAVGGGALVATIADPGLSQGAVTLKATAPGLVTPDDGAVVRDPAVVLTATSPAALYDVPWTFYVRFEVYAHSNPGQPIHSDVIPQGQASTTSTVSVGALEDLTLYVWRARAESDGAYGPWSAIHGFTTAFASIEPPTPLLPTGGIVTDTLRPFFTLKNGAFTGDVGTVLIEVEVSLDQAFTNVVEILRTHTRSRGETNLFLNTDLMPDTTYFWRGLSTNKNLPETSLLPGDGDTAPSGFSPQTAIQLTSDWSATATFRTPTEAVAAPSVPSTPSPGPSAPGGGSCCPPSNRFAVVQQVAAETGYPSSGIHVTDFTQAVAARLAQEDGDWGRRINDLGPLGKDTVAYRVNGQNDNPFSIDIVSGATTSNPVIHWSEHGQVGGTWTPAN